MLIDKWLDETFTKLVPMTTTDCMGGVVTAYVNGITFDGGISTNETPETPIANQTGMKTVYTIVTRKGITLHQNDLILRNRDGKRYRITSNSDDMSTPYIAKESYQQVTAEVIDE